MLDALFVMIKDVDENVVNRVVVQTSHPHVTTT